MKSLVVLLFAILGFVSCASNTNSKNLSPEENQSLINDAKKFSANNFQNENKINSKLSKPVFMVLNNEVSAEYDYVSQYLKEFLIQKKYDVKEKEAANSIDELLGMLSDLSQNSEDLSYALSLSIGADIYIQNVLNIQGNMISVELKAYESSTAKLLGSQIGFVKDNDGKKENYPFLIKTATKKAFSSLEKQILSYWDKEFSLGKQYKVVIKIGERFDGSALETLQNNVLSALKKRFEFVTINAMTERTLDLIIRVKQDKENDALSLYSNLSETLSVYAMPQKNAIAYQLIFMELK